MAKYGVNIHIHPSLPKYSFRVKISIFGEMVIYVKCPCRLNVSVGEMSLSVKGIVEEMSVYEMSVGQMSMSV